MKDTATTMSDDDSSSVIGESTHDDDEVERETRPKRRHTGSGGKNAQNASKKRKTKEEVNQMILQNSRPLKDLTKNVADVVKRCVDSKIFAYTKFLTTENEVVEAGYIQLVFADLNWMENSQKNLNRRTRTWSAVVEFVIKRVAARRAAAIATIKKACLGKRK